MDRRAALRAVRRAINENLPDGYEEGLPLGMIDQHVPFSYFGQAARSLPLSCYAQALVPLFLAREFQALSYQRKGAPFLAFLLLSR